MFGDVVDAERSHAALVPDHRGRDACGDELGWVDTPSDATQTRLARRPEDHRLADRDEAIEVTEQTQVVFDALAEPEPRIKVDAVRRDAVLDDLLEPAPQVRLDLADDIVVLRLLLHRARLALHVHQAAPNLPVLGDDVHHLRVAVKAVTSFT